MAHSYAEILCDITEFVTMRLEEGANPNEIIMALDNTKFSMMFQAQRQADAYATLHGIPRIDRIKEMK